MGRRYSFGPHGERFVAEDAILSGGRLQPQHAVWEDDQVVWHPHIQGGMMEPFNGPADVWLALTEGAKAL